MCTAKSNVILLELRPLLRTITELTYLGFRQLHTSVSEGDTPVFCTSVCHINAQFLAGFGVCTAFDARVMRRVKVPLELH